MNVRQQIEGYIADQAEPKGEELRTLHQTILGISPNCKLWFLDGRNAEGKIVSNPNVGYGSQSRQYAKGEIREFYQVGLSGNTTGISVYIMGVDDKNFLNETYGKRLGKAKITGYCVKFRNLRDVNLDVVEEMIALHLGEGSALEQTPFRRNRLDGDDLL
jgi:hypothetical protein